MSELIERSGPSSKEFIFPCDCPDGDYLRVSWDDDPQWRCLWVETWMAPLSLKDRLLYALKALRGKPFQVGEIILNEKTVANLKEVFNEA